MIMIIITMITIINMNMNLNSAILCSPGRWVSLASLSVAKDCIVSNVSAQLQAGQVRFRGTLVAKISYIFQ